MVTLVPNTVMALAFLQKNRVIIFISDLSDWHKIYRTAIARLKFRDATSKGLDTPWTSKTRIF